MSFVAGLSRRICIPLHANERTEKKVCQFGGWIAMKNWFSSALMGK
jgi:hypothetical protein